MEDRNKYLHNRKILLAKNKKCQKCGRTIGLEVHHIKPQSEGGNDEIENLQVLCGICHNDMVYLIRVSKVQKRNRRHRPAGR